MLPHHHIVCQILERKSHLPNNDGDSQSCQCLVFLRKEESHRLLSGFMFWDAKIDILSKIRKLLHELIHSHLLASNEVDAPRYGGNDDLTRFYAEGIIDSS